MLGLPARPHARCIGRSQLPMSAPVISLVATAQDAALAENLAARLRARGLVVRMGSATGDAAGGVAASALPGEDGTAGVTALLVIISPAALRDQPLLAAYRAAL